jgi:hypothetical protein
MIKDPEDLDDIGPCLRVYDTRLCEGCPGDEEPAGSKLECIGKVNIRRKGGSVNDPISNS